MRESLKRGRTGFSPLENLSLTGFSLIELIIVVIVISILVSIALPNYYKTVEKSRITEAATMLNAIYSAQMRYALKYDAYAINTDSLDINVTNGKFFNFNVLYNNPAPNATGNDNQILATAARNSYVRGTWGSYTIYINETGATWPSNPNVILP